MKNDLLRLLQYFIVIDMLIFVLYKIAMAGYTY